MFVRSSLAAQAVGLAVGLGACASGPDPAPAADARLATESNRLVFEFAVDEDRLLTLKGVRTAAMLHLAVHDALNSVDERYAPWVRRHDAGDASATAAAAVAASAVVAAQYPERAAEFDAALQPWLAAAGAADEALGRAAAAAVLSRRDGDRWDAAAEYTWHPMAPGVYAEFREHSGTPEGFVFGAGWAQAEPFVLERPDELRAPPPPAIDSAAYTAAFDEVKAVGRRESATRTADQTHLAMWWKDFVENSHSRLARQLIAREDLDLWRANRLLALLAASVFDAYVCVFDNKFHYNHWRPYTAIRWAANDGNPDTAPEPDWDNTHGHTYAFPSYPSAHGCASAAAMTALAETFGDATAFTMHTPFVDRAGPMSDKIAMDPPDRSFTSFSGAAMECALSRVYLGIHFRYDSTAGFALGQRIGRRVVEGALAPLP